MLCVCMRIKSAIGIPTLLYVYDVYDTLTCFCVYVYITHTCLSIASKECYLGRLHRTPPPALPRTLSVLLEADLRPCE